MTIKETAEYFKAMTENFGAYELSPFNSKHIKMAEIALSALEKQIPKKPRVDNYGWLCCPKCNETFAMFDSLNRRLLCCGCCGQKLDWSEVDAKKRSDTE